MNIFKPKTYVQALQYEHWIEVMKAELHALEANHTWYLTDLPPAKFPLVVGGFIASNIQLMEAFDVTKLEARLVAKGYPQQ
ncbi:hypothetical protein CR513_52509, partial [Mucuna pruriens]